jgi:hypothetical protein
VGCKRLFALGPVVNTGPLDSFSNDVCNGTADPAGPTAKVAFDGLIHRAIVS